eukprot:COSAG02_NODE_34687_length_480_cov_0.811024_1_plen_64_part_10
MLTNSWIRESVALLGSTSSSCSTGGGGGGGGSRAGLSWRRQENSRQHGTEQAAWCTAPGRGPEP